MKRITIIIMGLLVAVVLYGYNVVPGVTKGTEQNIAREATDIVAGVKETAPEPRYIPATRQGVILFVEDYSGAFGPATHPDPNWQTLLNNLVGSGNYGWYATTAQGQNGPDLPTMQEYALVIWNCYDDWWAGDALTATDQTNIQDYITGGGKVWLIGQDIIYSGVPAAWLSTNFHLASYVEDVSQGDTANIQGQAELAGLNTTFIRDYTNIFWLDDLTPDAQAHQLLLDVTYNIYPAIASPNTGDFQTSFWAFDGRGPADWAIWEAMVDTMLNKFGVLVALQHDVGVSQVTSPPSGIVNPGSYDVIGRVRNYGQNAETFDVTATVTDTITGTQIFTQTVNLTNFSPGAESLVNFGSVNLYQGAYFRTKAFTQLSGDENPANDTATVLSRTALSLGDVIYELDVQTPAGDYQLLGVEFDGRYFYVTGGNSGNDPNKVYVIDTLGNLIWSIDQPSGTGWGMRDLAWDDVYTGADRIDTLYGSHDGAMLKFGIDLTTGTIQNHGTITAPVLPARAMAWDGLHQWFFTANWDPCYKFSKTNSNLGSVAGPGSVYGAAYDTDTIDGGWVWWHSQNDPGTGYLCQIDQMEPVDMTWTGVSFGFIPTLCNPGAMAGGLCFYEGFRGADVLFALVQGTPVDEIVGIFVRYHTGIEEDQKIEKSLTFGFAPNIPNPTRGSVITYTITKETKVRLNVYDASGRLVTTLVDRTERPGTKTVNWDTRSLSSGVYFLKLEAEGKVATHKLILVK